MSYKYLIETIEDLEAFFDDTHCTAQITFRVKEQPRWLVRLVRRGAPEHEYNYRQAADDDLREALEMCYEAWLRDEESERPARRARRSRKRESS